MADTYMLDLQILLTLVVAGTWWALYRPLRAQSYYRWWAWGWTVFLVFLVGVRLSLTGAVPAVVATILHHPAGLLQVTCFALGAEVLRRGEDVGPTTSRFWLGAAGVVGLALAGAHVSLAEEPTRGVVRTLVRSPGLALAFGYCGVQFVRRRDRAPTAGVWITAGGFFLYALDQSVYSVDAALRAGSLLAGADAAQLAQPLTRNDLLLLADMVWEATIAVGAIVLMVEEKDQLFRQSRRNARRFQSLFDASVDGILIADGSGRIRSANPAALEMLGYDRAELEGFSLPELFGEELPDDLFSGEVADPGGGLTLETTCRTRGGNDFPVELSLSAYELNGRRRVQGIMRDISTRKALMERLTHRATHDSLTDLPNRHYLTAELERMLAMMQREEAEPAALFLDLDGFKSVNDRYGHAAGDTLLVKVADRLRAAVRETELVGQVGGDEFVVLIDRCGSAEQLRIIADRVAQTVARPYRVEGNDVEISASVGGALARDGDAPEDLLERADGAMYRAKEKGDEGSGVVVTNGG